MLYGEKAIPPSSIVSSLKSFITNHNWQAIKQLISVGTDLEDGFLIVLAGI